LVEVKAMVMEKHLDVVIKEQVQGLDTLFVQDLKVGKCLFSENCLNEVLTVRAFKILVQLLISMS
jgi:hypothetical protein